MRKLKVGDEVLLFDGKQQGSIVFACGKESYMVQLDDGDNVGPIHRSNLKLKQESPAPTPRVIVLEDE